MNIAIRRAFGYMATKRALRDQGYIYGQKEGS